jgi:signal transduction histidine kinase
MSGLPAMRSRLANTVDAGTRQLIDVMFDCAQRIERTTADLLDLSRVDREAGGEFCPSDGLQSAIRLAKARGAMSVIVEDQVEPCPLIHGRAADVNHVFLNLIDNAMRAVGTAGGRVRIEAVVHGGAYIVRVGDSGGGVPPELSERIFEPFFTTRQAGEGTGLGLTIARQVLQQSGGSLELGGSELGGALFTARLPLQPRRAALSVGAPDDGAPVPTSFPTSPREQGGAE